MKKIFIFLAGFVIFSAGAYCDIYFMLGADLGYANMDGNGGFYAGTFFDTQYYPFDGPIGLGLDLKIRISNIINTFQNEYKQLGEVLISKEKPYVKAGVDFMVTPTLSLRLFYKNRNRNLYPVLKAFPVFGYSRHKEHYYLLRLNHTSDDWPSISEPYIGGGGEICLNYSNEYPIKWGGEFFLTYSYGYLMHTKEKYFSIGLGARGFLRKSLLDKRAAEKAALERTQRQIEYAEQQERIRQQKEQERSEAEAAAIKSGSLTEIINFINQYGDSKNARLAIERLLSGNENQSYKELKYFENPYSFEKGSVYYCSSLSVYQWISEYSFLAKVDGEIIYVETSNIENVKNRISYAFLKANGVMEYSSAMSSLNIVPRFTLMLF